MIDLVAAALLLAAPSAPAAAAPAASAAAQAHYRAHEAARMVPLLTEVLRFDTVAGHAAAHAAQKRWLAQTAHALGLEVRDAGPVTEIELPGPPGAPVLGLVVHGDVQPVDAAGWSRPPFAGVAEGGYVYGRGAADDKGPLVQALLALRAVAAGGPPRTHAVRLLVGSDEESGSTDLKAYLATHAAPDYSLVLDSGFPVVVGEKAWNALVAVAPLEPAPRAGAAAFPYGVEELSAGLSPSIVPDRARLRLRWTAGEPAWDALVERLRKRTPDPGTRLELHPEGTALELIVLGKAAHGGVNLEGGRNALVSLARLVEGALPPGPHDDLLAFARLAGQDLTGTGLGLTEATPIWGRYAVNVALAGAPPPFGLLPGHEKDPALTINLRRPPPLTGPQLEERLRAAVEQFDARTGAHLVATGFYADEPFGVPPDAKLVRRLLAAYRRGSGRDDPLAISGGGTYAKRIPRAVAFGMWFPGAPYPGHDADEKVPVEDLHRGARVLIETLCDLASGPRLEKPFEP